MDVLDAWGLSDFHRRAFEALGATGGDGEPGRVMAQHKGGLFVATAGGERHAVVPGRLRRAADAGETSLPTVGDWVALGRARGDGVVQVAAVLPRRTVLQRKAAGEREEQQTLAANVDVVLLVTSLDGDLNLRRLERALAATRESGALPAVVLTKADLCADAVSRAAETQAIAGDAPVFAVVAKGPHAGEGLPALEALLLPGRTAVMLGTSGVGKSTLVNRWLGRDRQATAAVDSAGKGRHTTTHRELLQLPWGALVIDTPGLRELGLWDADEGVRKSFEDVEEIAQGCRFADCSHEREPGCAVRAAAESGAMPAERVESFLKLRRELRVHEARKDARARAESNALQRAEQRRRNEVVRKRR